MDGGATRAAMGTMRAVEAGATGYVLKDTPIADLVGAVRAAARGETVLAPRVLRAFAKLGVDGRTGAVTAAIERGYLPSPGR
jgi:DNA-binding NarL/FixJ family response regulator